ncbi:MAG TPA: hypothetical protein VD928_03995 [Candidatus Paceibacterota bacterium]|nr:hypothetical protein [Candidatus Paceibacterota bacterium]
MAESVKSDQLILAEIQVILAQMRTQLSILRAGMGLIAGSMTVMFLLLTNDWVLANQAPWVDLPVKILLGIVAVIGFWRLTSAERKIRRLNKILHKMERENKVVNEIMV